MSEYIVEPAPDWLIDEVAGYLMPNSCIAGGFLKDAYTYFTLTDNTKYDFMPADVDMFFIDEENRKEAIKTVVSDRSTYKVWTSTNSEKYRINLPDFSTRQEVDFVSKVYGNVEEILDTFDFTIVQAALYKDENDGKFYVKMHKDFLKDLENREIVYNTNSKVFNENMLKRLVKYKEYNYTIQQGENSQNILHILCEQYGEIKKIVQDNEAIVEKMLENTPDLISDLIDYISTMLNSHVQKDNTLESMSNIDTHTLSMAVSYFYDYFDIDNLMKTRAETSKILSNLYICAEQVPTDNVSYFMRKLLVLLDALVSENVVSVEKARKIFEFVYYHDMTTNLDEKGLPNRRNVICRKCNGAIKYCEGDHLQYISFGPYEAENYGREVSNPFSHSSKSPVFSHEAEIVYKSFFVNDYVSYGIDEQNLDGVSKEWAQKTVDFWLEVKGEEESNVPLARWRQMIEEKLFDPTIPPSLLTELSEAI